MTLELVANVWPVIDKSRLVLRFLIRAYAINRPDGVISETLHTLAETDFVLARSFPIPKACSVVSEHGTLQGCVHISDFHEQQAAILAAAFRELETEFARLQGIAFPASGGRTIGVGRVPMFPQNPYLLTTVLFEAENGQLIPLAR